MNIFIDTEFNAMDGELISMALVSEDGEREFYEVIELPAEIDPWVREHVIPNLHKKPIGQHEFRQRLRKFLGQFAAVHILADYPDDLKYFCRALITGPGEWMGIQPLSMEVNERLSAKASAVPHNALEDARALRESWFKLHGYEYA